ncbi:uncharacterized protein LOC129730919 [Wyeomyia smithii]|uniref:uncharacterized protein LOC129730919 n=1 Tax=Wyeomyia smithii TaxID=174621 RepID=UPI002467B6E9|nr:uncharacterized protein LOC129730919 [Wyeomyia smithii]
MTFFGYLLCSLCYVILSLHCSRSLPVLELGEADSQHVLKHVAKRQVNVISGGSPSNQPEVKNEVAAFLESGRMNNDYVWVDVTTKKFVPVPGNDLVFGDCSEPGELIYFDNTLIENSGPSILNGTLEIYIDAPVNITCVRAIDQIRDGSGGVPAYNSMGSNWAKIDVAGQYGKGFHFHIYVYGIRIKKTATEKDKERKDSQSNLL